MQEIIRARLEEVMEKLRRGERLSHEDVMLLMEFGGSREGS